MLNRVLSGLACGLVCGLFALAVAEDKAADKFEATCPVSGGPAKADHKSKYMGKDVFFCCDNCPKAFDADKKKYDLQAKTQFLETKQIVQVSCPFSGQPVNAEATVALGKAKVAFCCEKCQGKAKDSKELAKLVFADFDKGFTLQTKCPVSGKAIVAEQSVEHDGKKVFFCCPGCPDAFKADPAKFVAKLPQFKGGKKKAE